MTWDSRDGASDRTGPRVSVVMNVCNGARFVAEALTSALRQTMADFEVIVWDDCSTDDTGDIVRRCGDPRVRYVRCAQRVPLGRARDLVIREARGEWLAFLDQDDIWLPDKLQRQLALVDSDPHPEQVGLVYGRTVRFTPRGCERDFDHRHEFAPLPEGDIFEELFHRSCFICMSSAMLRRSVLDEIGPIPPEIEVTPDYFLFLAVARRCRAKAVQQACCRYRVHGGNMSWSTQRRMHEEALSLIDRWSPELPPALARRRRKIHQTVRGFAEAQQLRTLPTGTARIVMRGSLPFLFSRPLAMSARAIRRRFVTPFWRRGIFTAAPAREAAATSPTDLVLSVIVVNWNVRELLRDCLRAVIEQVQLPRDAWELIVVDNASHDGSAGMVRRDFPIARLIENRDNVGFARANNQAFATARGRYALLLNPDAIVLDGAVRELIATLDTRPEVAIVGGRLLNADGSPQRWSGGAPPTLANIALHFFFAYRILPAWMLPAPLYMEAHPTRDAAVGWVSAACMLVRRAAVGCKLFDERFFMYCEDLDLCQRLAREGWQIVYTPRARAIHYDGQSLKQQAAPVQVGKLHSLRAAFAAHNPRTPLVVYDAIVAAGFGLRYALAVAGVIVRPRDLHRRQRERMCRRYVSEALRTLLRRGSSVGSRELTPVDAIPAAAAVGVDA
jgi:GT2 family glycosyltransferase